MNRVIPLLIGFLMTGATVWGQVTPISEAEALSPPTSARLQAVYSAAQRDGWSPHAAALRGAAIRAYEREKFSAAESWLQAFRWTTLFGLSETDFIPRWMQAVQTLRVGHSNLPRRYDGGAQPLAARLRPALQQLLFTNADISTEFLSLVSPVDFLPRVFEILDELHQRDAARFRTYANLAIAIALVYDVPPPPGWPHGQVTAEALPRQFPAAADAFAWWIKQEQRGRTYHKLSRLGAEELKFVVDTVVPFAELEWAQNAVDLPLGQLPRAYAMVRYRNDRVTGNQMTWTGRTYTLQEILSTGGICSDQAYFASQVGKARGVPTLLVYGAGNDGRHAWFGFLDGNRRWQLDAGRYAEQKFVTGFARDPQTWAEFSDHELHFLTERFRELPSYRHSHAHEMFAAEYLSLGKPAAAATAARKAVSFERRNQPAWEFLIAAAKAEGRDAKTIESILREAALAFQRYPDLEASYVNRVADSLRARGETTAADAEVRRIANKNRNGRGDLAVQQARDIVQRAMATQPLAGQIQTYNTVIDTYGRGSGIGFYDEIVVGFAQHLLQLKQKAEAVKAVERARRTLKVEPNSQLATEFDRLAQTVKDAK